MSSFNDNALPFFLLLHSDSFQGGTLTDPLALQILSRAKALGFSSPTPVEEILKTNFFGIGERSKTPTFVWLDAPKFSSSTNSGQNTDSIID